MTKGDVMKVLIIGGAGMVGRKLVAGKEVVELSAIVVEQQHPS